MDNILEITYFEKGWFAGEKVGIHSFPTYSEIEELAERYSFSVTELLTIKPSSTLKPIKSKSQNLQCWPQR